jgi:NAD(P)-dependent dehydrogenase (short-subunit alcohol dehydrogenase family)
MTKTIVVVGYGPGISSAVAQKFGAEGFAVALVARNAQKLADGVAALTAKGIKAAAFPADASDPVSIRAALGKVRAGLGPITALHWNAFDGAIAGDLMSSDAVMLRATFDIAVVGLLAAVQDALPDLEAVKDGAVLITNGAFGENNPQIDAMAVGMKVMGLALANAAKHKLAGMLSAALKPKGVYVGEVMVAGLVKGSASDNGGATISADTIAEAFWNLYRARDDIHARVS